MTAGRPAELSLRSVAGQVTRVYRRHWLVLIAAALLVGLPQALADTFFDHLQVEGVGSAREVIVLAAVPITVAVNLFGQAVYAGFAAAAVIQVRAGHALPGLPALARSLPIGGLIVIDLVLTFGAAVGFALLIAPGLVFMTYFGISPAVMKIEHRGVVGSLRRSAQLVRARFWRVLVIMVVVIGVAELVIQAVTFPFHGWALTLANLAADGLIEPVEGVATVIVALTLLELRGEAPAPEALELVSRG